MDQHFAPQLCAQKRPPSVLRRQRIARGSRPPLLALAALLLVHPVSHAAVPSYYTATPLLGPTGPFSMEGRALNDFGAVAGCMAARLSCGTRAAIPNCSAARATCAD